MELAHVYYFAQSEGKLDFEYIDVNDDSRSYRQDPAMKMLSGMFRKLGERYSSRSLS